MYLNVHSILICICSTYFEGFFFQYSHSGNLGLADVCPASLHVAHPAPLLPSLASPRLPTHPPGSAGPPARHLPSATHRPRCWDAPTLLPSALGQVPVGPGQGALRPLLLLQDSEEPVPNIHQEAGGNQTPQGAPQEQVPEPETAAGHQGQAARRGRGRGRGRGRS